MDISKTFNVRKIEGIYEFSFNVREFLDTIPEKFVEKSFTMVYVSRRRFCDRTALMLQMFKGNYEITQFPGPTNGDRVISYGNKNIAKLEDELRALQFDELEDLLKSMTQVNKYQL